MLKLGSLKFCFGVSLLFHAVVFGVVQWTGEIRHPPALQQDREVLTLHLVAAPVTAPETVVAPATLPAALPPEPVPTPPSPPVVQTPPPVEEKSEALPLLPEPVLPPETIQPAPPPPTPVIAPSPPTETRASVSTISTPARGDGSSMQPGDDPITSQAQPGIKAQPNYLKNPEPVYPLPARRRQQQGLVLLEVKVSARGRAVEVAVKESSGHPILDEAALKAVRDWEFEPARVGMVSVESRIEVPVRFTMTR